MQMRSNLALLWNGRHGTLAAQLLIVLLAILAGCATHNNAPTFVPPQSDDVLVLADPGITGNSLALALNQVRRPNAPVAASLPKPATFALLTLPEVKKLAERPIIAVTEYQDWIWYATDVARDSRTQVINSLIAGYAVQKGARDLIKWGAW
jgi:hypothetical protein